MKRFLILFLIVGHSLWAQEDILAKEYYKNGDYEKALIAYQKLYDSSPSNVNYINQIVSSQQQLEQYTEANAFLESIMKRVQYPAFYVEMGYNYQLSKDQKSAEAYYKKALDALDERPTHVFAIARGFQNHSLLNEAATAYEKAMVINPNFNFSVQLAQIYGEQGQIEKMFTSYIEYAESNPSVLSDVKRAINDFISEDSENENNILFKKILLKKMQQDPKSLWNSLLSWLFIQQKEYKKAFIQEKAIYNRQQLTLHPIFELAEIAGSENETALAKDIYNYLIETTKSDNTKLEAHFNILEIDIKTSNKNDYPRIKESFQTLISEYPNKDKSLDLQIAYANFLAFYLNETDEAISFLEDTLEAPLNKLEQAQVKLKLGDILVIQEKFNKALIYYTQIQRNLKNSTISQEARFKVAKASYYKGDFKWAESQLKILKSSTSQLIANDALDLKLLITDNKYEDSLQTALKIYAKADLLAFQNRNDEAIILLDKILEEHKTEPIIAQTLYKQAQLYEIGTQFDKARNNYEAIIANYRDGILIDDAYFNLAKIYEYHLNDPKKAKDLYEKIIFNHADSIYFVESRKHFRALRGDAIN
ncbi:tetratricopeptide repeat protein [Tamlana sp. 2_MG-2023]|uniref:tetratricopeptide repeat protein n=1 Tax=unclassified Tamlana TaxID=2614803 RepID=UPI0026E2699B|nr:MULTISPECIES: tetratricopeptide repeat protein [unclassified Tamlana]MDO6759960.1 tetratricopeptide repeat protein [Tamlana sp. 2_MG-2023]MDO6791870.1 tetratricopeptide repeat protein [Tamlana sp. 1_MG-2023]